MFHMVDWFSLYISYILRISLALGRSLLVNYDGRRACRATLSCICIESGVDIESKQTFQKLEKSETRFRVVQVKYKTSRFQYRRPLTAHRERSSDTSATSGDLCNITHSGGRTLRFRSEAFRKVHHKHQIPPLWLSFPAMHPLQLQYTFLSTDEASFNHRL